MQGYDVEIRTSNNALVKSVNVSSRNYTITGLNPGTDYYFLVRTSSHGAMSNWTTRVNFTTQTATPVTPTISSVSSDKDGQTVADGSWVKVTVSGISNATKVDLYTVCDGVETFAATRTISSGSFTYDLTVNGSGKSYTFRAYPYNGSTKGTARNSNNPVKVQVGTPTIGSVSSDKDGQTVANGSSVTVTVSGISNTSKVDLYTVCDGVETFAATRTITSGSFTYNLTVNGEGNSYTFRAYPYNGSTKGAAKTSSNPVKVQVTPVIGSVSSNRDGQTVTDGSSVTITVSGISNTSKVDLYTVSNGVETFVATRTISSGSFTYDLTVNGSGKSYTFRAYPYNGSTKGTARNSSNPVTVQTNSLTVSPTERTSGSGGGLSSNINITSNTSWTVRSNNSWIHSISKTSGSGNGTFNFRIDANTSSTSRTGTLTITGGGFTRTVTVVQDGVASQGGSGGGNNTGTFSAFSQRDDRWRLVSYTSTNNSSQTIGSSGCGLLSITNAVYALNGNFIDPRDIGRFSVNNGHRTANSGTAFSLYKHFADVHGNSHGFRWSGQTSNFSSLRQHLENGGTAVISVTGHVMSIAAYRTSNNGQYMVLESATGGSRGLASTNWLTETQIRNLGFTNAFLFSNSSSVRALSEAYDLSDVNLDTPVGSDGADGIYSGSVNIIGGSGRTGDTVEVLINVGTIAQNGDMILIFDSSKLTYISAENGDILSGILISRLENQNTLKLGFADPSIDRAGTVIKLKFKILDNVQSGTEISINLKDIKLGNDIVDNVSSSITVVNDIYTVTFDPDGGNLIFGELTQRVAHGESAIAPFVDKPGYDFVKWNTSFENVTKNLTIKAEWKKVESYKVTFDLDGGELMYGDLEQIVKKGESAISPSADKIGFIFIKWDKSLDNITANQTIKAIWEPEPDDQKTYTVKFDLDGGSRTGGGQLTQNVEAGKDAEPPLATKKDHVFVKWDKSLENISGDITIKAVWEKERIGGLGDVNGDGSIDSADALLIMKYSIGLIELTEEQKKRADVNGDGEINAADAIIILRTWAGFDTILSDK